jgi:Ca2+-binding RTX toxin-like protein
MPTTIRGTQGDDVLNGTANDDVITDTWGDDIIDGGAGNDTIVDGGGSNTVHGGTGDDFIDVDIQTYQATVYADVFRTNVIDAGDGNDIVHVTPYGAQNLTIDLGIGSDLLTLSAVPLAVDGQISITTGSGPDRIVFDDKAGGYIGLAKAVPVVVTDFTAGAGGDVLDLGEAIGAMLGSPGANPFADGHLVLIQDGADTIVRFQTFGADVGDYYNRDIARLTNVTAANLTAYNFAGYDPSGGALTHNIVNGATGSEWLNANVGGSDLNGLGGNDGLTGNIGDDNINGGAGSDVIKGGSGNDTLDGGTENDTLDGGVGNDIIQGGAGDDTLTDPKGADILDGGAGNDTITISRAQLAHTDALTISGGDGNDLVRVDDPHSLGLTLDLGAGNDRFELVDYIKSVHLTLGAGQDRVVLGQYYLNNQPFVNAVVISDFTVGNGGDVLDFDRFAGGDGVTNPFSTGYWHLEQDGADTLVIFDYDGNGPQNYEYDLFRLISIDASTLTAFNFGGFAPDGSPSSYTVTQGTAGDDHLYGSNASDVINGGDGNDLIEESKYGDDTLNGGNGDDTIILRHASNTVQNITINGGAGNDFVDAAAGSGNLTVDLGDGNDRILLYGTGDHTHNITLGTGSDTVELTTSFYPSYASSVRITDFQTGDNGDRLDWATYVEQATMHGDADYNPFLERDAILLQVGADVQLQLGRYDSSYQTILTFANTNVADFTAYNLGYNPFHPTQTGGIGDDTLDGTALNDVLDGTSGNDQLNGNDGDDVLWAGAGADALNGGNGNDHLRGESGDDVLHGDGGADNLDGGIGVDTVDGGDGNDVINDRYGNDTITGGAGDDRINVYLNHPTFAPTLGSLNAGDGNDFVEINNIYARTGYAIDLGAGDDTIKFDSYSFGTLVLGAGRDTVIGAGGPDGALIISDFQPGDGGDTYDLLTSLYDQLGYEIGLTGWNPFRAGWAQLKQVGNDVRLYIYPAGYVQTQYSQAPVVIFQNTDIAQFTSANFGTSGWDPHATPNRVIQLNGDYANNVNRNFYDITPTPGGSTGFMFNFGSGATFTNNAKITVTQDYAFGGAATGLWGGPAPAGSMFVNSSGAELHVHYDFVPFNGNLTNGGFPTARGTYGISTVQNDGVFEVTAASGVAYGVQEAALTNTGTLTVTSAYDAYGLHNDNDLIGFSNTGTINVHGDDFAMGLYYGDLRTSGLTNAGTITVSTDPSSPYGSIGIYLSESVGPPGGVYETFNSGTITADIAYYVENDHSTDLHGKDLLHNSGTMNGNVVLSFGDDTVDNTGTINGNVLLGDDNDRYDGAPGHVYGTVEGGRGNDTITGGNEANYLYGDAGRDTIYGGLGDDFIEGGPGRDTLYGQGGINDFVAYDESLQAVTVDLATGKASDGIDIDSISQFEGVVGSRFSDTIRGADAAETFLGGDGDDHIDGGAGSDTIRGEAGSDDLTGGTGNDFFLFSIGDGADIIRDFSAGDHLSVYGYATAATVTQVGADVLVSLSGTDHITLLNTTAAAVQAGLTQSAIPLGDAVPTPDQTIVVANENFILPTGVTVALSDPSDTPYRQTLLSGYGVLLTNFAKNGAGPDFFNAGTFSYTDSGLPLITGLTMTFLYADDHNNFVNEATGSFVVHNLAGDAVGVSGITQTYNYGSISVIADNGDATGFTDLPPGPFGANWWVNAGSISVEASGHAIGVGQIFGSSASTDQMFNLGTLNVHSNEKAIGIDWTAPPSTAPFIVNSGSIVVSDGTSAKDSIALSVYAYGNGQVWNSGTLQADYGIKYGRIGQANETGTITVYNSGQIIGDIDMSPSAGKSLTLINTGTISGAVKLSGANDVFDSRGGTYVGTVTGNNGNDQLLTGAGSQTLLGGIGDDTISGGAGADILTGGAGADHFRYETGFGMDTITDFDAATDHVDVRGYGAWQSVVQQGGDVVVTFAAGEQLIFKNQVVANITAAVFSFGADAIADNVSPAAPGAQGAPAMPLAEATGALAPVYGTAGADTLNGTSANEALTGAAGNDTLNASSGNDRLDGGTGNDILNGGTGADIMLGGAGNDTYSVDNAFDVITEYAGEGTDLINSSIAFALGQNIENLTLTGSASISGIGNDLGNSIRGNSGDNSLNGAGGDDYLYGNAGNDALVGGAGYDRMYGGVGDDTYYVNDVTDFAYENAGEGHDTVVSSIDLTLRAEVEDLALTGAAFIGKGNILDNAITGTGSANKLYGYEGSDTLNGQGGDDYLFGADGNDTLIGGAGYDRMYGGVGDDTYYVNDTTDFAYENSGEGTDRVISSLASYQLRANIEELDLAEGGAAIRGYGQDGDNTIVGNSADNFLYGRDGNDLIKGNGGNDILYGENGNDTLFGGAGMDRFYGGSGADKFAFRDGDFAGMTSSTADRIHDFDSAQGDKIHLSGVDANSLLGGDQAFSFVGTAAFSHNAGELRTYQSVGNTYVAGDINGDGIADFVIRVDGLHAINASDLIL